MGTIITIMPSEYTKVDIDEFCNTAGIDINSLKMYADMNSYGELSNQAKEFGLIPDGYENITDIKLINEDSELWIRFE